MTTSKTLRSNMIGFALVATALSTLSGCDLIYRDNARYYEPLCQKNFCGQNPQGGVCAHLPDDTVALCTDDASCAGADKKSIFNFTCLPPVQGTMPGGEFTSTMPDMGPKPIVHVAGEKGTRVEKGLDKEGMPMLCIPENGSPIAYLASPPLTPDPSKVTCVWLYESNAQTRRVFAYRNITPETPGAASIPVTQRFNMTGLSSTLTIESGKYWWASPTADSIDTVAKRFYDIAATVDFLASSSTNGSTFAETPPAFPQCTGTKAGECVF